MAITLRIVTTVSKLLPYYRVRNEIHTWKVPNGTFGLCHWVINWVRSRRRLTLSVQQTQLASAYWCQVHLTLFALYCFVQFLIRLFYIKRYCTEILLDILLKQLVEQDLSSTENHKRSPWTSARTFSLWARLQLGLITRLHPAPIFNK